MRSEADKNRACECGHALDIFGWGREWQQDGRSIHSMLRAAASPPRQGRDRKRGVEPTLPAPLPRAGGGAAAAKAVGQAARVWRLRCGRPIHRPPRMCAPLPCSGA